MNEVRINPSIDFANGIIEVETKATFNNFIVAQQKDILDTKENIMRECLLRLGWTPPKVGELSIFLNIKAIESIIDDFLVEGGSTKKMAQAIEPHLDSIKNQFSQKLQQRTAT